MGLRVFILSDLRLYGDGLADALGRKPDIRVVGTATDVQTTLRAIRECEPELVLVDVAAAGGVSSLRRVRAAVPDAQLVAIAVPETDTDIFEYAEAGIVGYVMRSGSLEDLVEAVEGVGRGEVICPDRLTTTLFRRVEAAAAERADLEWDSRHLTPRELEVVELVEEGLSNREIAERLCIALPTVKNHLHNIFEKLHVHRRAEAAALVRRDPQVVTLHQRGY